MGCFDVYCTLCGVRLNGVMMHFAPKDTDKEDPKTMAKTHWLGRCTVLRPGQKAQHGFQETTCNCTFQKTNGRGEEHFLLNGSGTKKRESKDAMTEAGLVVHTDCWKAARAATKVALTYDHFDAQRLQKLHKSTHNYVLSYLKYAPASKYNKSQFFANDDRANVRPADRFILYSPLGKSAESKQNAARVVQNARAVVARRVKATTPANATSSRPKPGGRLSPSEKAREFKNKRRRGNDGNMWRSLPRADGVYRWVKA